jgi:hypothetical protein
MESSVAALSGHEVLGKNPISDAIKSLNIVNCDSMQVSRRLREVYEEFKRPQLT